ncbi:MAG: hypothetical protein FWC56_06245, partial [Phycisphaerae bacterium]|nr:hypothetical protein [Phycisphaerae bacterium]
MRSQHRLHRIYFHGFSLFFGLFLSLVWVSVTHAQEVAGSSEESPADVAADVRPTSPPPGEEVMRPTAHGLMLTPGLTELFAQKTVDKMSQELQLTPVQKTKAQEVMVHRIQDTQRQRRDIADACEASLEQMLDGSSPLASLTPEAARRLAKQIRPTLSVFPEFMEGLRDDFRPILNDEQIKKLDHDCEEAHQWHEQTLRIMDRWAQGDVRQGESLFELLNKGGKNSNESKGSTSHSTSQPMLNGKMAEKSKEMQQAEAQVDAMLMMLNTHQEWAIFFTEARRVFG